MKQAVFTIVAQNYLTMGEVLGESVKHNNSNLDFYIIVADSNINSSVEPEYGDKAQHIIGASELQIPKFNELAFKYNVTEFCTALKPFSFNYLLNKGYDKVIYFDPDIYVFSSLHPILDRLDSSSLIVTPHVCTLQNHYTGLVPEPMLMHVGIYNFGFCAFANTQNSASILEWWQTRLIDQCYADKLEALHTDQKWMDFIPSLTDDIYIERHLGCNMAIWNWHERLLHEEENKFWVSNRVQPSEKVLLIFFHFSNFSFGKAGDLKEFKPKYIKNSLIWIAYQAFMPVV